jgi:hypothetical protein
MTARSGFAAEPCPAWLEKCELCAVPVASRHGHLVDTGRRGLLDLWTELSAGRPLFAAVEPDVEAILFHEAGSGTDCFLVPIDACYRLIGTVRRYWTGRDGGPGARRVGQLFAEIRDRAQPLER